MRFVIVTGLSGAGRSAALRCFEDMDYFCVDNLPPKLISDFVQLCSEQYSNINDVALVVDARVGNMFHDIFDALDWLKQQKHETEMLFLEADKATLVGRFDLTRRRHPLYQEGMMLEDAIDIEIEMMTPLRSSADRIIDTTNLSVRQLRSALSKIYSGKRKISKAFVTIISFGYKYGVPLDADFIYDMRFLPNPYYVESMRKHTGQDEDVINYVMGNEDAERFLDSVVDQLTATLPLFEKEGKTNIVVGVGCTGGQHRSVVFADALYNKLTDAGQPVEIVHRDILKDRSAEYLLRG